MQNKKNKNSNRSKPKIIWILLDIVVFRLVAYLRNMICLIPQLLYKITYIYIYFRINLKPLYINFLRQKQQIYFYMDRLTTEILRFILFPLSFFLNSPFNTVIFL